MAHITKEVFMIYDKEKLNDLIERLESIKEYDYITYRNEDNEKVKEILSVLEERISLWEELHNANYSN